MKRYDFPTPRLAFGIAAVALTALTLTLSLVVPAKLEVAPDARSVVATPAATQVAPEPYRTDMVVTTSRIEVVATRTPTTAATPAAVTASGRRHQV
jgi:hypothetical protein